MKRIAYIFPGQGSQSIGMGKAIYDTNEEIQKLYHTANDVLNKDLRHLMFNGPEAELTETENTQPALLLSSIAVQRYFKSQGIEPVMTVGHSLGEYSALVAANALTIEEALPLVETRGKLMEHAYPKGKGSMAAVLGLTEEEILKAIEKVSNDETVNLANINCPGQIVISGSKRGIEQAETVLKDMGARRIIPLNVSGPFHSDLMKPASERFTEVLNDVTIKNATIPVYANVTASPVTEEATIKRLLIEQLYSPVKFEQCIRNMLDAGVDAFVEVGSGRVLSGLIRKIDRNVKTFTTHDLKSIDQFISWYKGVK